VRHAAGLGQHRAGPGLDDPLCNLRTDHALQHHRKGQHPSPPTVMRMLREHDEKAAVAVAFG